MQVEERKHQGINGEITEIFVTNDRGLRASFSNLGARINRLAVPTEQNTWDELILGYDELSQEYQLHTYYGATVGRVAGRLDKGVIALDGQSIQLAQNNGDNHLHGGNRAMDLALWDYEVNEQADETSVIFTYTDVAGTEDYPGNLQVKVSHTLTNQNEWLVRYEATSDATTLWNPTNHVYFNLNGNNRETVHNHTLQLGVSCYLPLRPDSIPEGPLAEVTGTAFDFRQPKTIGEQLALGDAQVELMRGFDHPFILDEGAEVQAQLTLGNRRVTVATDCPSVVIYTHNWVPVPMQVWGNDVQFQAGITFETQVAPDAFNHPEYGQIVLAPNQLHTTETKFTIEW